MLADCSYVPVGNRNSFSVAIICFKQIKKTQIIFLLQSVQILSLILARYREQSDWVCIPMLSSSNWRGPDRQTWCQECATMD